MTTTGERTGTLRWVGKPLRGPCRQTACMRSSGTKLRSIPFRRSGFGRKTRKMSDG